MATRNRISTVRYSECRTYPACLSCMLYPVQCTCIHPLHPSCSPMAHALSFLTSHLSPLILSSGLRILRGFHGLFNDQSLSIISHITYYPIPTKLHIILPPLFLSPTSPGTPGNMTHALSCNSYASCLMSGHVECLSNPNSRNAPASSSLPSARLLPLPYCAAVDWWEIIMPMGAPAERDDPASSHYVLS